MPTHGYDEPEVGRLLPPQHGAMTEPSTPIATHLAPLGVAVASLGVTSLLGATAWKPTLGDRWPLTVVQESPLYSYPFSVSDTVPYGALMVFGAVFSAAWCLGFEWWAAAAHAHRRDVWLVAWCGCWESYAWTTTITQLAKVWIQEPRPDFRDRCWPDLQPPFPADCQANVSTSVIEDGLKSFPSGHASTAGSLGVYLSAYAMWCAYKRRGGSQHLAMSAISNACTQLFQRATFVLFLMPFIGGVFVGASRVYDWRHHPWDVTTGFGIGGVVAACMLSRVISELEMLDRTPEAQVKEEQGLRN